MLIQEYTGMMRDQICAGFDRQSAKVCEFFAERNACVYEFYDDLRLVQTVFLDSPSGDAPEKVGTVVPFFVLSFAECLLSPDGSFARVVFEK